VRAAADAVIVAMADDQGAALAAAVRGFGATVFEVVDGERLRALLRAMKPAAVLVDEELPGAHGAAVELVRACAGYGDVAMVVVAREVLPSGRVHALYEGLDATVVLDGGPDAALVETVMGRLFGKGPAGRTSSRHAELQGLRAEFGLRRDSADPAPWLERVDGILAADRWDAEAHLLRGTLLDAMKRPIDALWAYELATVSDPVRAETWVALATACDRAGLPRKAERCWRRASDVAVDVALKRRITDRLQAA